MKVELEGPAEFHGVIIALIMQRRGTVVGASEEDGFARVEATVPLGEMFGFSTALRSSTQGKAEFTMEFSGYERCPAGVMKELMEQHQKAKAS
jgi:elongation factor G